MTRDERLAQIPGSAQHIYATDEQVREIYDIFCEGYKTYFNTDPKKVKSMFNASVMRSVQGYVSGYGIDMARAIMNYVFDTWHGRNRGNPVGVQIFLKRFRWLTDIAMTEVNAKKTEEDMWL